MKNISKYIKVIFSLIITGIFVCFIIKEMNFSNFIEVLYNIRLRYLLPVFLMTVCFYFMFAYRWKYIFTNFKKKPKFSSVLSASIISYMGNTLLPARLGEVLRMYIMKKKGKVSYAATLATIVLEKVLDGIAIMFFFFVILFFSKITRKNLYVFEGLSYNQLKIIGYIISSLYILLIFLLILFRNRILFFSKLHTKIFTSLSKRVSNKITKSLVLFARGLSIFNTAKDIFIILLYSLIVWFSHALIIYFCFKACMIEAPFAASFFVLAFIGLAYIIPSSPGAFGALEFFVILALSCYGVDKDRALGFALLYHVLELGPVCLVGIYLFFKEHVSVKDVRKKINEIEVQEKREIDKNLKKSY